jgi:hypothetical protein
VGRVVSVLARALAGFQLDEEHTVHAARSLRSALHGFTVLEATSGHPLTVDLDESFERLVTLLCAGVRAMADEQAARPPARKSVARRAERPAASAPAKPVAKTPTAAKRATKAPAKAPAKAAPRTAPAAKPARGASPSARKGR